jgi:hypothetical protein
MVRIGGSTPEGKHIKVRTTDKFFPFAFQILEFEVVKYLFEDLPYIWVWDQHEFFVDVTYKKTFWLPKVEMYPSKKNKKNSQSSSRGEKN